MWAEGNFLPEGAPQPWDHPLPNDFSSFESRAAFKLAELIFHKDKMSAGNINELMRIWADTLPKDQDPPFNNKQVLYDTIDAIEVGDAPWKSFSVSFAGAGNMAEDDTTPWKHAN